MEFQKGDLVVIKERDEEYYKDLIGIYLGVSSIDRIPHQVEVLWFSKENGSYRAYPRSYHLEKFEG